MYIVSVNFLLVDTPPSLANTQQPQQRKKPS